LSGHSLAIRCSAIAGRSRRRRDESPRGQHLEDAAPGGGWRCRTCRPQSRRWRTPHRVEAIGESRRRLVEKPEHVEIGQPPGILRGLPLRVVEVGGHRDHGVADLLAERRLGPGLQGAEDLGRHLHRPSAPGAKWIRVIGVGKTVARCRGSPRARALPAP
jgi:hypothetical protein